MDSAAAPARVIGGHALRKAMRVLSLFGHDRPELGASDVARLAGWPRSSVARLLVAMYRSGFLDRDGLSGKYRVGLRLAALGALVRAAADRISAALGHVDDRSSDGDARAAARVR